MSDNHKFGEDSEENELECHKWCKKTEKKLIKIFGEKSIQVQSFKSNFDGSYGITSMLGTTFTEKTYFYDNLGKGVKELEAIVEDFESQKKALSKITVNNIFDLMNFHPKVKEVS
jgi:glucose-6-phosphate isomerase